MSPVFRIVLFGHPVGHSRSVEMFRHWSEQGGPSLSYEALDVRREELAAAVARLRGGEWDGANVTIPHKQALLDLLDETDPIAVRAGAVNVIVREAASEDGGCLARISDVSRGSGSSRVETEPRDTEPPGATPTPARLHGANTDGAGLLAGCERWLGAPLPQGETVILGAGGAARGVAAALAAGGSRLSIVSRDPTRAKNAFEGRAHVFASWREEEIRPLLETAALIVQATPLGMEPHPEALPTLPYDALRPDQVAVDLVYRPWETRFLREVRRRGLTALNGWPMLVHQAALAAGLWFGESLGESFLTAAATLETRDPRVG